ncbi:hypothetical protein [Nocardia sp. CA-290969]|uniref:hypothetical protein n=1 Tax=Nocardia sp. CA-290969 TaxID=3239986 RepID=UPI003D91A6A2
MTDTAVLAAGNFLVDWAERMEWPLDPTSLRGVLERACTGQLDPRGPDGRLASTMTRYGIPLEVSVSGGRGEIVPTLRYTAEAATQETSFATRVTAQCAVIRDLAARLPNSSEATADMLASFVATLYPAARPVPARCRSAAGTGIVHHPYAPEHIARLKVYGSPAIVPGTFQRLCSIWPEFTALASVPDDEKLIELSGTALEVDAYGQINYKIYFQARPNDAAVPMKLVRHFGEPAWELMSELVSCGLDATDLHRHTIFFCNAPGGCALLIGRTRDNDLKDLARELAARHHGSAHGVDSMVLAAESSGATWHYTAVALGFSADSGINKLNVYGAPLWTTG